MRDDRLAELGTRPQPRKRLGNSHRPDLAPRDRYQAGSRGSLPALHRGSGPTTKSLKLVPFDDGTSARCEGPKQPVLSRRAFKPRDVRPGLLERLLWRHLT